MENFLYFAAADINTGGSTAAREGICVPASSYIGADPISTTTTAFYFNGVEGSDEGVTKVLLTHGTNNNKAIIKGMMACINANRQKGGFVVVADSDVAGTSKNSEYTDIFNGDVTTVAISEVTSGNDLASSGGAISYGAGLIDTGALAGPEYRRWTENGVIVNQVKIDLTGLAGNNDEGDVIGLAAGGAAYLFRQVVATTGVIFKIDMACIEAPTSGANNLADIDLRCNSSSVAATTDGNAYTALITAGGAWTYGSSKSTDGVTTCGAANDYYYLVEGDASGGANTYTAGQFIITFYGHPSLG